MKLVLSRPRNPRRSDPSLSPMKSLCVFCGSSPGRSERVREIARALGVELAKRDITLVFGGGRVGLMGVVTDAALEAGGKVIGVLPKFLATEEVPHDRLTELFLVDTMHQRKAMMAEKSDAFIALPGGHGTLDELIEIITWAQLGLHKKPIGVVNIDGFFDHLIKFFDRATEDGFIHPSHRGAITIADDFHTLLDAFEAPKKNLT